MFGGNDFRLKYYTVKFMLNTRNILPQYFMIIIGFFRVQGGIDPAPPPPNSKLPFYCDQIYQFFYPIPSKESYFFCIILWYMDIRMNLVDVGIRELGLGVTGEVYNAFCIEKYAFFWPLSWGLPNCSFRETFEN